MKSMNAMMMGWFVLGVCLFQGCATSDAELEAQRREKELREDNDNLRRQVTDQKSVESALQRELQTKNAEYNEILRRDQPNEVKDIPSTPSSGESVVSAPAKVAKKANIDVGSLATKDIEVLENTDGTVTLRLAGASWFKSGQSDLTDAGKKSLDKVASTLAKQPSVRISVEGHTDAVPLSKTKGVYLNNTNLSLARAVSVHDYLAKRSIEGKRMSVTGFGEKRPLMAGTSKAANEKNRRVELVLSRADD